MFIFPVQLTTSRIGNLTCLIHTTLLYVMTMNTYIHTYIFLMAKTRSCYIRDSMLDDCATRDSIAQS